VGSVRTVRTGDPVVAVTLHGVAHSDDLAVQAFARHLSATAGARGRDGAQIIAGMRAFLEGKPHLLPDPPWSEPPATGDRAVKLLAVAAGCTDDDIARARRAARHDLARSAWILDPADGFEELLALLAGRTRLVVVADRDDPATGPVLDALELADRVVLVDDRTGPIVDGPALLIDGTWAPRLAQARAAGHTTALVDRFGADAGEPDLRARDLPGLLPGIAAWLDELSTTTGRPA
jgi:FMN phosphatase YigB (HAD superfamily)